MLHDLPHDMISAAGCAGAHKQFLGERGTDGCTRNSHWEENCFGSQQTQGRNQQDRGAGSGWLNVSRQVMELLDLAKISSDACQLLLPHREFHNDQFDRVQSSANYTHTLIGGI